MKIKEQRDYNFLTPAPSYANHPKLKMNKPQTTYTGRTIEHMKGRGGDFLKLAKPH